MGYLGSLTTITLTIILVPWVLRRMSYFKRPDVVARRVAKARLPGWVLLAEWLLFGVSESVLIIPLFLIEGHAHQALHQGRDLMSSAPPAASVGFIFWLIQILAPVVIALPLGMLLANLISWLIPPIRNLENEVMAGGVSGYTWHDLNYGLIKFTLVATPICVVLTVISLTQV